MPIPKKITNTIIKTIKYKLIVSVEKFLQNIIPVIEPDRYNNTIDIT